MMRYDESSPVPAAAAVQVRHPLSFAIVGMGRFGFIHASKLPAIASLRLDAIVDCNPSALSAKGLSGIPAFTSVEDLPAHIQAAAVTSTSTSHAQNAAELMQRGCHVLVEKPLATSLPESLQLLETARRCKVQLCTGHTSRFSHALDEDTVRRLREPLASARQTGELLFAFRRYSPLNARAADSVLDLMVHDLDLLAWITGAAPDDPMTVLERSTTDASIRATVQLAGVRATFESGYRPGQEAAATLDVMSKGQPCWRIDLRFRSESLEDPLTRQYHAFVRHIDGEQTDIATGQDGRAAVLRALQVFPG